MIKAGDVIEYEYIDFGEKKSIYVGTVFHTDHEYFVRVKVPVDVNPLGDHTFHLTAVRKKLSNKESKIYKLKSLYD